MERMASRSEPAVTATMTSSAPRTASSGEDAAACPACPAFRDALLSGSAKAGSKAAISVTPAARRSRAKMLPTSP